MNLVEPKGRWLAKVADMNTRTEAALWADICKNPLYRQACEVALGEMVMRLGAANQLDAVTMAYKLEGAKQVLAILSNLGEPERGAQRTSREPRLEEV